MLLQENQETHFIPDSMAEDTGEPEQLELGGPVCLFLGPAKLSCEGKDLLEDLVAHVPAELEVVTVFFPGLIIEPVEPGIEHIQEVLKRDLSGAVNALLQGDLLVVTAGQRRIDPIEAEKVKDKGHGIIVKLKGPDISRGKNILFIRPKPEAFLVKFGVVAVGVQAFADLLRQENCKKDIVLRCAMAKVLDQTGKICPGLGCHV
jgi:hypothetical protein